MILYKIKYKKENDKNELILIVIICSLGKIREEEIKLPIKDKIIYINNINLLEIEIEHKIKINKLRKTYSIE